MTTGVEVSHFSFGQETCVKCGNSWLGGIALVGDTSPRYENTVHFSVETVRRPSSSETKRDRLYYKCGRCGFNWTTDCRDAEQRVADGS